MATPRKKPEDKLKVGRPTTYTPELAAYVCKIVATHTHGLKKLHAMYEDFPDHTTIALWRFKHKEFSSQYLEAKQAQMDLTMENLDDVLDESLHYYTDEKGNQRIDSPSATIAIAKANNRKWFASKIAPKLYGDRTQVEEVKPESFIEKILNKVSE
jgi:hypothetical protein